MGTSRGIAPSNPAGELVATRAVAVACLAALSLIGTAACGSGPSTKRGSSSPAPGRAASAPSAAQTASAGSAQTPIASLRSIAFADPLHGWAGGQGAIVATADGGRAWVRQYDGPLDITALDFTDAAHGWAVGDQGLLRTTDGGATWTATAEPARPVIGVDFVSQSEGWAWDGQGGFWRTNDAGSAWTAVPMSGHVSAACFTSATDGFAGVGQTIQATTNGSTWTSSYPGPSPSPGFGGWQLACAAPQSVWGLLIAGAAMSHEAYVVVHSTDGGLSWKAPLGQFLGVPASAPAIDAYAGPFAVAPGGTAAAFSGSCAPCNNWGTASLTVTADGGRTWVHHALVGLGAPMGVVWLDRSHGWLAVTQGGRGLLLSTSNSGGTWSQAYPPGPGPSLGVDLLSPKIGYGLGTPGDPSAVLRTADGGVAWTRVGTLPGSPAWPQAPSPTPMSPLSFWDAESGYAITPDGGLARSSNGGVAWTPVAVGAAQLTSVAFTADGRDGCVERQDAGTFFGTTDGGRTWSRAAGAGGVLACALALSGTRIVPPAQATLAAVHLPGDAWAVQSGSTVTRTHDGGATWTATSPGLAAEQIFVIQSLSFADPENGLLLPPDGRLLRTTDGGATWTAPR